MAEVSLVLLMHLLQLCAVGMGLFGNDCLALNCFGLELIWRLLLAFICLIPLG